MSVSFFSQLNKLTLSQDSKVKLLPKTELNSYIDYIKKQSDIFSTHLCFFELPDKQSINILSDSMINYSPDSLVLANISEIVASASDKNDLDKLDYYREKICC